MHRRRRGCRDTVTEVGEFLKTHGWQSAFAEADSTDTGHSSAGVALLWKPFLSVIAVVELGTSRRLGVDVRTKGNLMRFVCLYGLDSGTEIIKY